MVGMRSQRKDDTAIDIMQHPQSPEKPGSMRFGACTGKKENRQKNHGWRFLDYPAKLVAYHGPPFVAYMPAVGLGYI